MTSITRRSVLGGMAAMVAPSVASARQAVDTLPSLDAETQEAKCYRLTHELLLELRLIKPHGQSKFGPYVDLSESETRIRHARNEKGGEVLTIFIDDIGGAS